MRLPIHVEDIAEAFVRVSLADSSENQVYNSGGTPISLGDLAEMVRGYLPDAQISFDNEGGPRTLWQLPGGTNRPAADGVRAILPAAAATGVGDHQRGT